MKEKRKCFLTVSAMAVMALGSGGIGNAQTACESEAVSFAQTDEELTESIETALELTGLPYEITDVRDNSRNGMHYMNYQFVGDSRNASMVKSIPEDGKKACFSFLFTSDREAAFELPFRWEDWKQEISFTETVCGWFSEAGSLYKELSSIELPEAEESYDCQFHVEEPFGTAEFFLIPTRIEPHLADPVTQNMAALSLCIYEDQQFYEEVENQKAQMRQEYEEKLAKAQE